MCGLVTITEDVGITEDACRLKEVEVEVALVLAAVVVVV